MAELRIASLLPSTTEIACGLGFLPNLVGRSHECDFPAEVTNLPVCTAPKCSLDGPSREIDRRVRSLVAEGLSVYRVDAELLRELSPDVILTQSQCEVCAASFEDVEAAVCGWLGALPQIVSLAPATLADVIGDVQRVADALGAPERGGELRRALEQRMAGIAEKSAGAKRPTVACVEWTDPLMTAGNWMPELVAHAGGENLFGEAGKHSPVMDWEELRRADPEVIVALPCGFDLARTRREMEPLVVRTGWQELRAVRAGRVYLTDGNAYFNRPGPRIAESLEVLAEILHPELFEFGYAGHAFERWVVGQFES
jgi:iron complex transport system substrate-binding protein